MKEIINKLSEINNELVQVNSRNYDIIEKIKRKIIEHELYYNNTFILKSAEIEFLQSLLNELNESII